MVSNCMYICMFVDISRQLACMKLGSRGKYQHQWMSIFELSFSFSAPFSVMFGQVGGSFH